MNASGRWQSNDCNKSLFFGHPDQRSSSLAPVFLVPADFCLTKALVMTAAENSRGKQKEWGLSIFHDWEFDYYMKKKTTQKTSRFILPLWLKKGKPHFKKNLSLQWITKNVSAVFDFYCIFCFTVLSAKRHRNFHAGPDPSSVL